jgi:L-2-hydroxyglutarate oxidase LhgO
VNLVTLAPGAVTENRAVDRVDAVVIGAGAVGLAVGRALAGAGLETIVLERENGIGSGTSSRNSEVIHAGLYYPTGSLKARLCVAGRRRLYPYCEARGVPHRRCGKLLVATGGQTTQMEAIEAQARINGVDDLRRLSADEARAMEPALNCTGALLSPSTGIIDSHGFMLALEGHIEANGGSVVLRCPVERMERDGGGLFRLTTGGDNPGTITTKNLVNSAGLHASKLARTLSHTGGYSPPETYYAKGQYYALSGRSPFKRHIYPMPDGAWLGLHATVDIGGRCKFGPDIEWTPGIDYSFRAEKLEKFLDFIRSYYPSLEVERLHPDYTGVRPKLYREGEPVPDFAIHGPATHGVDGLVALYGIESPGLTASLAIGEVVVQMLPRRG